MRRTGILIVAVTLGLAACGGSSNQPSGNAPRTTPANVTLPAVEVRNSGTGETVNFASVLPAEKPVLFWFWAPH